MERIIAAVDGSAASLKAVAVAADLASKYGAELILLTVTRELSAALTAELETFIRQEQIDARGPAVHVYEVLEPEPVF